MLRGERIAAKAVTLVLLEASNTLRFALEELLLGAANRAGPIVGQVLLMSTSKQRSGVVYCAAKSDGVQMGGGAYGELSALGDGVGDVALLRRVEEAAVLALGLASALVCGLLRQAGVVSMNTRAHLFVLLQLVLQGRLLLPAPRAHLHRIDSPTQPWCS